MEIKKEGIMTIKESDKILRGLMNGEFDKGDLYVKHPSGNSSTYKFDRYENGKLFMIYANGGIGTDEICTARSIFSTDADKIFLNKKDYKVWLNSKTPEKRGWWL
jgi:hypothetical protein